MAAVVFSSGCCLVPCRSRHGRAKQALRIVRRHAHQRLGTPKAANFRANLNGDAEVCGQSLHTCPARSLLQQACIRPSWAVILGAAGPLNPPHHSECCRTIAFFVGKKGWR